MKKIKKIISIFLLSVFCTAVLPPDLIHQFAEHHDTIDCFSIETSYHPQHQHCLSLQLSLPSYLAADNFKEQNKTTVIENKIFLPNSVLISTVIQTVQGRAPPLV